MEGDHPKNDEESSSITTTTRNHHYSEEEESETEHPPRKRKHTKPKHRLHRPAGFPKRPLSAYNLFSKETRAKLLAQSKDGKVDFGGVAKEIGSKWNALSNSDKKKYETAAEEDIQRYRQDMANYEKSMLRNKQAVSTLSSDDSSNRKRPVTNDSARSNKRGAAMGILSTDREVQSTQTERLVAFARLPDRLQEGLLQYAQEIYHQQENDASKNGNQAAAAAQAPAHAASIQSIMNQIQMLLGTQQQPPPVALPLQQRPLSMTSLFPHAHPAAVAANNPLHQWLQQQLLLQLQQKTTANPPTIPRQQQAPQQQALASLLSSQQAQTPHPPNVSATSSNSDAQQQQQQQASAVEEWLRSALSGRPQQQQNPNR